MALSETVGSRLAMSFAGRALLLFNLRISQCFFSSAAISSRLYIHFSGQRLTRFPRLIKWTLNPCTIIDWLSCRDKKTAEAAEESTARFLSLQPRFAAENCGGVHRLQKRARPHTVSTPVHLYLYLPIWTVHVSSMTIYGISDWLTSFVSNHSDQYFNVKEI